MRPRQIITAHEPIVCEICRRTLLRGEFPVRFVVDGSGVNVCELCEPRALHEGWVREGREDEAGLQVQRRERRSFLRRLRGEVPARRAAGAGAGESPAGAAGGPAARESERERKVRGVPTSTPLKIEQAIELFNSSGLPQRMAGICRSLGAPVVAVRASVTESAIVRITIAWELAWYRFEVDLGDQAAGVRPLARGTELRELDPSELEPTNALSDDGMIVPAA